jgi:hypothetical protein
MLKSAIMTATKVTAGATVGLAFGVAMIPVTIAIDLTAPVSYPIISAATVAITCTVNKMEPYKPAMVIGAAIGALMVPWAPLSMVLRPVATPFYYTVLGGVVGSNVK